MGMKPYRSYMFINKDPVLDVVRTAIDDSKMSYEAVAAESGVNTGTIYQWLHGRTKRPQHCTVMAVLRATGKELVVTSYRPKRTVKVKNGKP